MANEESFNSLDEDRPSDLSANRKRKSKATVENGRSAKSRRWSDAEVDRLIELLEERPCLWDVFCKEYHVREKRERAYEEIENELEIELNDIKTKIVGLRSQLGRELSKTNNKKSGQALNENYKSNWIYWDSLQFLVPVMQAGKSKDNLPDRQSSSSPESFDSISEDASPEMEKDEAPVRSRKSSKTSHEVAKRCLESSKTELISTCIQVLKEPSNAQEGVTQCHFSKYVSEKLANFDRRTRLIAEKRISDILFELEMNDQSHQIMGQSHFTHSPSGASGFMSLLQDSQHYR